MFTLFVHDVGTDPYLNAELRHPVGSSRIATISSKYAGVLFISAEERQINMTSLQM